MSERFKILNAKTVPLEKYNDLPAERLKSFYDISCNIPSRPCIECGKMHNMVVTDRVKETHEPIDKCYDCFWKNAFYYKPITEQVELSE